MTGPAGDPQAPPSPEATALMLATFAELYRHEIGAEEDVHRTLPFFGTALGVVIAALAYAAGRLPRWTEAASTPALAAFWLATALLALAVMEAVAVLAYILRAIVRREYLRIGPEPELRARLAGLRGFHAGQGAGPAALDRAVAEDMRQALLDSYAAATPRNRAMNERRYRLRARASLHLIGSLFCALGATTVIFIADKLAYLPKAP